MRFGRFAYAIVVFVLVLDVSTHYLNAQNTPHNEYVDEYLSNLFENVTLDSVSTGYLKDRAFEAIDFFEYDGLSLTSSNTADFQILRNCFLTINSAKVNSTGTEYNVPSVMSALTDSTSVVLGAALFKYNYIVANAITDSLLIYSGGKLYDSFRQNVWQNPYDESYTFVFAPSESYHTGTDVHFKYSSGNIYSNCQVQSVQVDFDDGNGYVTLGNTFNQTISYLESGTKDIKMRVTLNGGAVLQGHAALVVDDYTASQSGNNYDPDDSEVETLYYDNTVSAIVSYKYRSGHYGHISKPIIFVEGFDDGLVGLLSVSSLSDLFEYCNNLIKQKARGNYNFSWLYKKLIDYNNNVNIIDNYDIVYVDWKNPDANIMDNAVLLANIINKVNQKKTYQSVNNIVIGHSMGGLIARYALSYMERNNMRHQTSCYVSYDAPHLGVNVPLGAQYALWDFFDMYTGWSGWSGWNMTNISGIIDKLLKYVLDEYKSVGAKQMMYYYTPYNSTPKTLFHDDWQDTLDSIGFPEGDPGYPIENLAVAKQWNNDGSDTLLTASKDYGQSVLFSNLSYSFGIFKNKGDGGLISTSSANYKKTRLWAPDIIIPLLGGTRNHYSINGATGYDNVYSSLLAGASIVGSLPMTVNDFAFVPTASALSVNNYTKDYNNNRPEPLSETPFHSYRIDTSAVRHDVVSNSLWKWLLRQEGLRINWSYSFADNGDVFSCSRVGGDYKDSLWTTSSDICASFNVDTLVVHHPGPVRITYKCRDNDSIDYYKHKTLFVGKPSMRLSKVYTTNGTFRVCAHCVDSSIEEAFWENVASGVFSLVWGKKVGNADIIWSAPGSDSYYDVTVPSGEDVSVFLKLRTCRGTYGETNSILVQRGNYEYFCHDPQAIYVTNNTVTYDFLHQWEFVGPDGLPIRLLWSLYLWRNDAIPNTLVPDAVTIGNESFPLASTISATLNGTPVTLYKFNIAQSSVIQQTISEIQSTYNNIIHYVGDLVNIKVVCSGVEEQTLVVPVVRPL